jgi:succinate-acetate transporter protein
VTLGRDSDRARIVLRPIASSLPLGFLALSAATSLVSALQLGWLGVAEGKPVALMLIAFVVPLQLITSVFGFLARDGAAATGMGILAGTWLSVALVILTGRPGATSDALGVLLLVAAVAMLVPASAALRGKLVPAAVLCTTSLRFLLTALYQLTASSTWADAAGIVGLFLGALAVYAAFALELEDSAHRTLLPVGRRGTGAQALTADLDGQLSSVAHEAGVRTQL